MLYFRQDISKRSTMQHRPNNKFGENIYYFFRWVSLQIWVKNRSWGEENMAKKRLAVFRFTLTSLSRLSLEQTHKRRE